MHWTPALHSTAMSFTQTLSSLNPSMHGLLPDVEELPNEGHALEEEGPWMQLKPRLVCLHSAFPLGCVVGVSSPRRLWGWRGRVRPAHMLPGEHCSDSVGLPHLFTRSCPRKANAVLLPTSLPPPRRTGVLSWAKERGEDNSKEQQREVISTWIVTSTSKSRLVNIMQRKMENWDQVYRTN